MLSSARIFSRVSALKKPTSLPSKAISRPSSQPLRLSAVSQKSTLISQYSTFTRISPFGIRAQFLERKGKNDKKRRNDDYDPDDDDDFEVPAQKGKSGGKSSGGNASAPAKGGKAAKPAEWDPKSLIISFDANLKKLTSDLATIKIGRAEPQLLASVKFDGEPLIALGQIQVRDPQTLSISLYDTSLIPKITKAINLADPSLNPNTDGKVIFVPVPKPTPEHKRNLLKNVATLIEKAKVDIRNGRRDAMNDLKSYGLPKDENKIAETQIQKLHDDYIKKIDAAAKAKEQELSK